MDDNIKPLLIKSPYDPEIKVVWERALDYLGLKQDDGTYKADMGFMLLALISKCMEQDHRIEQLEQRLRKAERNTLVVG